MRAIRFSGLLVLATAACPPVNSPGGGVESVQSDLNAPNRIVLAAPADVAGGTSIALSDLENWVHWGLTGTGANRKANVTPQLARVFTKVGSGTIAPDPGSSGFPHYVWNNGSPTVSADTKAGIKTGSTSTGFQFSVPVTTTPKRTRIYLTIFSAKATLEVKMAGATTVTSIIDQMGATRRTVSVDADIWSATTQEATVNLTLGKNYGGGLVILNAAATLPLDRAFSNAAHTLTVTPAAGAPQPVRYGANESPTGQLLPLVGSHVSLQARFTGATRDLLYGGELWRDNALWRETSTVSGNLVGFDFDETVAGTHVYTVIGVSQFGARAASEEIPLQPRAYASSETPVAIPDLQCVSRSLLISGASGTVSSTIDVIFSLDHSYPGDLKIELISPFGTAATLVSDLTAGGYGMVDTRINSEPARYGLPNINAAEAPYTGAFGPSGSLQVYNNQQVNGVWIFRVCDQAALDDGVLKYVGLYVLPR